MTISGRPRHDFHEKYSLAQTVQVSARSLRCLDDVDMVIAPVGCLGHIDMPSCGAITVIGTAGIRGCCGELLDYEELPLDI